MGLERRVPTAQSLKQTIFAFLRLSHAVTTWNFFFLGPREETLLASSRKVAIPASESRNHDSTLPKELDRVFRFIVWSRRLAVDSCATCFSSRSLLSSSSNVPVASSQNNRFPDIWTWSAYFLGGSKQGWLLALSSVTSVFWAWTSELPQPLTGGASTPSVARLLRETQQVPRNTSSQPSRLRGHLRALNLPTYLHMTSSRISAPWTVLAAPDSETRSCQIKANDFSIRENWDGILLHLRHHLESEQIICWSWKRFRIRDGSGQN